MNIYEFSLAAIDVGFDVRLHDMSVRLPVDLTFPVKFTRDPPPHCGTKRLTTIIQSRAQLMQEAYACCYTVEGMNDHDLHTDVSPMPQFRR